MGSFVNNWIWGLEAIDAFDEGFELVQVYDDGSGHTNEVAVVKLSDGQQVVTKAMLLRPHYQQRIKALMEVTVAHIDDQIGGDDRVVMPLHARFFRPSEAYDAIFGPEQPERPRIAHLIWKHAPGIDGEKWWRQVGTEILERYSNTHPDGERMALIDMLVLSQDRALKNWVTDYGKRFYAIDNGMAWYNQQPYFFNPEIWGCGCTCLIQENGWGPVAGVFSTAWAGQKIRLSLISALENFDVARFRRCIDYYAEHLGFPEPIAEDFRFDGILRRMEWFIDSGRFPTKEEFYSWRPMPGYGQGSPLMNAKLMLADGAKAIWRPDWEYFGGRPEEKTQWEIDRAGPRTEWPY